MPRPHNMKVVTRRTGLSPHVLRVWEKRYQAVSPTRNETNRRLYTELEIEKLELLAKLTTLGHSIGRIAGLEVPELRQMLESEASAKAESAHADTEHGAADIAPHLARSLEAVRAFDIAGLEDVFDKASVTLGYSGFLERLMVPLLHHLGDEWHQGLITTAQEHAASAFIKDYLARTVRTYSFHAGAPSLLVATPAGQLHELGAIIVANLARKAGWNVIYLGASLPPEDIAGAALRMKARAVALSIVYPHDDPNLPADLLRLRKLLPKNVPLLVGGRAADGYAKTLAEIGALTRDSLAETIATLEQLRASA